MESHWQVVGQVLSIALAAPVELVQAQERPAITVLVYNHAAVPVDILRRATERMRRIYLQAGVEVECVDPATDRKYAGLNPTSSGLDKFMIQVLIRRHAPGGWQPGLEPVMGMAIGGPGDSGGTVFVYYEPVLQIARHRRQPLDDILAYTLAHEMGHVLLPSPSHAQRGIMQPTWDGDDLQHAADGSMSFTQQQAALIWSRLQDCCLRR